MSMAEGANLLKYAASNEQTACKMCLEVDPVEDLIKPCACSGSAGLVHRECLDKWRAVSPHPEALSQCEICKTPFKMVYREEESDCWRKTRFGVAVSMDIFFFLAIFAGVYLLTGLGGDAALNNLVRDIFCEKSGYPYNYTWNCPNLPFVLQDLWAGRIWFYGFTVFFFFLGIVGCLVACCCKDEGSGNNTYNGRDYYDRGDCYWICCGPSYYNGYYYYSPYGYWGANDLCCWMCWWDMHMHHHSGCNAVACTACCTDCSGAGNCNGNDSGNGVVVLLVIVLIVIAVFILIGVIFGTILSFMIMGKIIQRHMNLLERRASARNYMVADLRNAAQVAEADRQLSEGLREVIVPREHSINAPPQGSKPQGKQFDDTQYYPTKPAPQDH